MQKMAQVKKFETIFRNHFKTQGTPIFIGGDVKAYTMVGIKENGACLIVDPIIFVRRTLGVF